MFDPYKFYHENKDCEVTNVERTGNKAVFDFGCQNGVRANANGNVQYSVDGDNLSWTTEITNISGNDDDVVTKRARTNVGKCK